MVYRLETRIAAVWVITMTKSWSLEDEKKN
jgi:hypothetical protein